MAYEPISLTQKQKKAVRLAMDSLSIQEKFALAVVFISAMEHDWNDWEEMCGMPEEELARVYSYLHSAVYPERK